MKKMRLFLILGIISLHILFQSQVAFCQEHQPANVVSHYTVIGAFAVHSNATEYTEHARQMNLHAQYIINPNKNLYYVYVLQTDDLSKAVNEALRLRKQNEFANAWVYHVVPEIDRVQETTSLETNAEAQPEQKIDPVKADDAVPEASLPSSEPNLNVGSKLNHSVEGANFFFKIFRSNDNKFLEGEVNVIDVDRSRKIGSYKGNIDVKVSDPASKSDNVSLVCEVFGYRKLQRDVNFNLPEGEGIKKTEKGLTEIPFEMVRMKKGDIAVMFNVFFYKDAAIMRPESKFEVTELLEMMKENPNCKIKIHGHANGGGHGKIISMESGSTNFFTLTGGKDGFGSSTQLSEARAEIIRNYLINAGIEESRMQIKAWGGKRPIHDKDSARAQENVRVEIEILEN